MLTASEIASLRRQKREIHEYVDALMAVRTNAVEKAKSEHRDPILRPKSKDAA